MNDNNIIQKNPEKLIKNSFSEKEQLFIWLYFPQDFINKNIEETLTEIINISTKYKISNYILFRKIIEYLHIKELIPQDIINILIKLNFVNKENIDDTTQLIDIIIKKKINSFDLKELAIIIKLAEKYKINNSNPSHEGYPLPDPYKGRPRLEWSECYFEGCHKTFSNSMKLIDHLKQLTNFINGLHLHHENAVYRYGLTPQKIISQKMRRCPSFVCDKANYIFTPEELCNHYILLGIKPFWFYGLKIKSNKLIKTNLFDKIFDSEECIICYDIRPSVLFLPCNHCLMCIGCYKEILKCPFCRTKIEITLPI